MFHRFFGNYRFNVEENSKSFFDRVENEHSESKRVWKYIWYFIKYKDLMLNFSIDRGGFLMLTGVADLQPTPGNVN